MRIGVQDVLLLIVGLAFTIAGAFLLVAGPERGTALAVTAFFGTCTAVFAWSIAEKRGLARSAVAGSVSIAGGVRIPVRRGRMALLGGGLFALGTLMATAGSGLGVGYVGASLAMAAAGLLVLGALLAGRGRAHDYLVFEVEGLRFGFREGSYLVGWSDIGGAEAAMYQRNPIVLIWLAPGAGGPVVEGPESVARRHSRSLESSRAWLGADLSIVPGLYGLDAVLLSRAIVTYAQEPGRRQDLAACRELPEAAR